MSEDLPSYLGASKGKQGVSMLSHLSEAQSRHLVTLAVPTLITVSGLLTFLAGGQVLAFSVLIVITGALLALAWMFRPRW